MKKFISLFLAVIMSLSSVVFTMAEDNTEYENTLKGIKSMFNIGDFDDFDSYTTVNEGKTNYYFTWVDDYDTFLYINCDSSLNVLYYWNCNTKEDRSDNNTINKTQAKAVANDFMSKCIKLNSYYKLNEDETYLETSRITFVYDAYVNGCIFPEGEAKISVNLVNGNVESFYSDLSKYDLNVEKITPISDSQFKDKFTSDDNMELIYTKIDDSDEIKPVYTFKNYIVDAKTGEFVNNYDGPSLYLNKYGTGAEETADSNIELSGAEIKELEQYGKAVTIDEGKNIVLDKFGDIMSVKDVDFANYYNTDDGYELQMSFVDTNSKDGSYFRANATISPSGVMTSFSAFSDGIVAGEDKIKSIAKKALPNADIPEKLDEDSLTGEVFYNLYNGIKDNSKNILIAYDENKNITEVRYNYDEGNYVELDKEPTKAEILNAINSNLQSKLKYMAYNDKLKLVYGLNQENILIDANTKEILDLNGNAFKDDDIKYTDISGTWYEEMAESLMSLGYKFDSNLFEGDKIVTGRDLVEFMTDKTVDDEDIKGYYDYKKYEKFIENPDTPVTKYDMADLVVGNLGQICAKFAKNAEFVKPFADVDSEHINSVAILKALGIAKGVNNMFEGDSNITRANMCAMVYYMMNYII